MTTRSAVFPPSTCDRSCRRTRNHALTRRLNRFRLTALPTFLLTVTPRRIVESLLNPLNSITFSDSFGSYSATKTTRSGPARRFPWRMTRRKSRESSSRSARANRPVRRPSAKALCESVRKMPTRSRLAAFGPGSRSMFFRRICRRVETRTKRATSERKRALLRRIGRCEALATLRASALQNGATRLRLHSLTKAVFAKSLDSARLKCPLHRCGSSAFSRLTILSRFICWSSVPNHTQSAFLARSGCIENLAGTKRA
jgi:hypothetical protein